MTPPTAGIADPHARRRILAPILAFAAVMALVGALLWPGTTGGFRFDDYPNLGGLAMLAADPSPAALLQYLVGGVSSPLGRPISLLSFALQMRSWPDDAAAFIGVNILLHLMNGALLLACLMRVAGLLGWSSGAARWVPLAAAALWLAAPIQLTSVLYVVQRMTELSASFVFLGLLLYLIGRARAARGGNGLWWMSAGVAIGTGLGALAKENALLLPLLLGVLEATLLAGVARPAAWWRWASIFLAVPTAMVLGYLGWVLIQSEPHYAGREFTLGERLLSEPRVLFLYLHKLLLPWPSAMRLWYDDFTISAGLFEPWTTTPALVAWLALALLAWRWRRRAPMAAFAVLWFLAAHLLESSVLPLELVFEHRNYVAGAGIWLALAAGAYALLQRASGPVIRAIGVGLAAAYFGLLAIVTWQAASLWGQPFAQTVWMADRLPESRRAMTELIGALIRRDQADAAIGLARTSALRWPDDPSFLLQHALVSCQVGAIPHPDAADLRRRVAATRRNVISVVHHLDALLSAVELGHCPIGTPLPLSELTGAAVANSGLRGQKQNRLLLHARALRLERRPDEARAFFDRAIDAAPKMLLVLHGALQSLDDGDLAAAQAYVHRAATDPRIRALDRWTHRADLAALEALLAGATPPSR